MSCYSGLQPDKDNKLKKLSLFLCLIILCASFLCACSGGNTPGEDMMKDVKADENLAYKFKVGKTEIPPSFTSYKTYASDFAFRLLKSMYNNDGNTIIASAGLYSQLSLLENAASDTSLKELKDLTGKNQPVESLNECNAYFFSRLKALSNKKKGYYVDVQSNLFLNSEIEPGQQFLLKNADFYKQGIFRLDFSDEKSTEKINDYISEQTNKKVEKLLSPPLPSNSSIISTGSALMRDKWLNGYDRQDTKTDMFSGSHGAVNAEFMTSTEFFLKGKRCTGFEKSFKSTPCKFIALLPDEDINIYQFVKGLDCDEYLDILSSMNALKTCEASLPKFTVKYEDELTNTLNKNGVYELFKQDGSLKNLSLNLKGSVGGIHQSLELSVNEAGIGSDKPNLTSNQKNKPDNKVELNRPFVFLIVDNESYIPLYAGIISSI